MISTAYELASWSDGRLLLGCDEAGYGCIAGSMFVAGVVFDKDFDFKELATLNDSKALTEKKRFYLEGIIRKSALHFFCKEVSASEIDAGRPYHLRFDVAKAEIEKIQFISSLDVIMDGNVSVALPSAHSSKCLVKGDGKCLSIAAASVLAKCAKDRQMLFLHKEFPVYGWDGNKGYESSGHREAILKHGLSPHHRRSYCKKYLGGICI
jgi:ribonuclease HII